MVVRDHLDLWVRICADSYESAICGFWNGGIVLNLGEISHFSSTNFKDARKILPRMIGMDTFEIWKKWVRIRYPFRVFLTVIFFVGERYCSDLLE